MQRWCAMDGDPGGLTTGWLPIETAPKDEWPVLVTSVLGVAVAYWDTAEDPPTWTACAGEDTAYDSKGWKIHVCPTHWRPCPAGPNGA